MRFAGASLRLIFAWIGVMFVLAVLALDNLERWWDMRQAARAAAQKCAASRRGVARPAYLSETDFCGCCGRHAVVGQLWCFDCAFHIREHRDIPERTWYAQYGTVCPFVDFDQRDHGDETDVVPEGGVVLPPGGRYVRDEHDKLIPLGRLHYRDQEVFSAARKRLA